MRLLLLLLTACETTRVARTSVRVTEEPTEIALAFQAGDESATFTAVSRTACEPLLWNDGTSYTNGTVVATPGAKVSLRRVTTGESDVDIIAVYAKERERRLRLDLNIFVTGAAGLSLEAAKVNPRIESALSAMWKIFAHADIYPGEVRFMALPLSDASVDLRDCDGADPDPRSGATALQQTKNAPRGVNVLLVQDIASTKPVSGYSALPGGVLHDVRSPDGVVLSFSYFDTSDDDPLGQTLAHEIGHYLGLFHNVEADGTSVDPLGDTPRSQPDALENLMYYASGGRQPNLTADQVKAMRRHPILY